MPHSVWHVDEVYLRSRRGNAPTPALVLPARAQILPDLTHADYFDTSVAHLAGALGRPVWILLPFVPDWRWLLDREDSPWYTTARLFRQSDSREWQSVVERVHDALQHVVRNA